jgi:hypothetical protein
MIDDVEGLPGVGASSEAGIDGPVRFAVELDSGAVPIAGRVVPSAGAPLDFSGYVELITALESLRPRRSVADTPMSES